MIPRINLMNRYPMHSTNEALHKFAWRINSPLRVVDSHLRNHVLCFLFHSGEASERSFALLPSMIHSRRARFHFVPIARLNIVALLLLVSRVTSSAQVQFQAICG